jgi:hypothetical protein
MLQCSEGGRIELWSDEMEARVLIAYLLIGLLVGTGVALYRHLVRKRREYRRNLRGHGWYKRHL